MKYFFLILVMLTAIFFRVWRISETPPGLYPDEAMNGNNALEAIETDDFKVFYPENNGREGLFINIQAISVAMFGNKPWVLRIISSLFGIFTVLGVYFLAKELFYDENQKKERGVKREKFKNLERNETIALIASFFLAASFWHINFSRIGFRAIMAPFFLVWGLYFLLKTLNKLQFSFENCRLTVDDPKGQKLKILFLISGFVYGLGFHSYIAYRATPILILLVFFYFWFKNKEARKKIFVSAVLFFTTAFVAVSPLIFYFINNPQDFLGRTSQISVFSSENPLKQILINTVKTFGMFWFQGDLNFRHNINGNSELWFPVGILFAIGILMCLFKILKLQIKNLKKTNFRFGFLNFRNWKLEFRIFEVKNILPELLLLTWLIIGLLPVVISNEGIPHALRAIIVLPAVMIISATALQKIIFKIGNWLERQKEKYLDLSNKIQRIQKEMFFLLIFFFITIASITFNQYFFVFASSPYVYDSFSTDFVKFGNYLNTLPQNMEKYVIVNENGTDVRGMPMPTQTIMFITKTFLPEWQKEKNLYYVLPQNLNQVSCINSCVIVMLDNSTMIRKQIKEQIKNLASDGSPGFMVLRK